MSSSHLLLEQAKLDAAQIGFSAAFNLQLRVARLEPVLGWAMRVPSTNAEEQFPFLGDLPMLREWVDERHMSKLRAEKITVINKDFSTGIRVDRNDILDDRLGLVMPRINGLADRARQHISDRVVRLLLNGFNGTNFDEVGDGLAYDGQFFFSTTHQDGDGPVQSNFITAALTATSYETQRVAMQSLKDEEGQPLEIRPMALLVGPKNERTALEIVQAGLIDQGGGAGVENVFKGTAQVMMSQRLTGSFSDHWFLADLTQGVRPLIWTDREAPRFDALNTMQSEGAFMRKEFLFGTSYRGGYGYGLWQFAAGSDGTT